MRFTVPFLLLLVIQIHSSIQKCRKKSQPPHIIVIIGDDIGHNDVSLKGSNQIPTPNIDALGYNGIVLDKYYVQNSCSPSRTAFLTGNYPIRTGMQGIPILSGQNRSMPMDIPTMPEHLKKLGYKTHLVGKWHLGAAYRKQTPTERGFDSHFGYWHGFTSYFGYQTDFNETDIEGFDLHDGFSVPFEYTNQYATSVFTKKSLDIIDNHNPKVPLFLVVAHLAAHAGKDGTELGVPDQTFAEKKYSYIQDGRRRLYAEIVNLMDESIGHIMDRLYQRNMLKNSIVLFFSDNGAPTVHQHANSGSNWPLRGLKLTNFEGAVRGTCVIFSPKFKRRGYVNKQLFHVSDWLPTLYHAAGGDINDLGPIDGINQWDSLSKNVPTSRSEILVNIDELQNTTSIITHDGRYKLVTGIYENGRKDGYFGDSGRHSGVPPYNMSAVIHSTTNTAIQKITKTPITIGQIVLTRADLDLSWCKSPIYTPFINCSDACLFNLEEDPCETTNIMEGNPDLGKELLRRIQVYWDVLVPQGNMSVDPMSNPQRYNNTWCTWLDDSWCVKTPNNVKLAI